MYKRILSLLLALLLCLSAVSPALAAGTGYSDVPESHWAAGSIRRAGELGLFQGVGGGLFGRGQPITRSAFVTALVRLFGWEAVTPDTPSYTDVTADQWYYSAVETARANGAFVTSGKTFRPRENITREEMAVMLVRSLGYASLAGTVSSQPSPFSDVVTNRGFITLAYDMGIVSGMGGGRFAPRSTATREQAAAVMVRVYDKLYAQSTLLESAEGYALLSIPTPQPAEGQELPTTPLEPMAELYTALQALKQAGTDMKTVALSLCGGGVRTVVSSGRVLETRTISAQEVAQALEQSNVRLYYSDRYESAYCIYPHAGYQTVTLWYQSEVSLAAKLKLARLFGVEQYVLY